MGKISGLRRYYGSEAGNVLLGQLGFDIIGTTGSDQIIEVGLVSGVTSSFGGNTTDDGTDAQCWVCIQVNDPSSSCVVSVKSAIGNDFSSITFTDGMKIYGVFTAIKLTNNVSASLICYRG